jgi:ABC-type Na+ efflux pump permease subunit
VLPVAERELRIGARSAGTYASRRNVAALLFLVFAGLYWNLSALGAAASTTIFATLVALCYFYSLLAGLIIAADCISSEKRSGTLGLLFLTALKPRELIAGAISASSLKAFYGLLATFPILGLSLFLGGIEYGEFARVCLALVSALFFSLSLSLLVSCLSQKRLLAIGRAALLLFVFCGAIPILCAAIQRATTPAPPDWANLLNLFSPTTTLELATRSWFIVQTDYALSLLFVNVLSLAMLIASSLLLPWIWKDRAGAKRFRLSLKTKSAITLRARNPFYWLARRQSSESTRFLIGFILLAGVASIVGRFKIASGTFPVFESQFVAWAFLLVLSHFVLVFKFAALSTARLAEDRELGALESILVTPLRVREILRGQCQALFAQLSGPALAVLVLHGIILWAALTDYSLEQQIPGGASGVIRAAREELRHGSLEPWGLFGPAAMLIISAIMAVCGWIALASIGMWIALRARHASRALWISLAVTILPPAVALIAVISFGLWLDLHHGANSFWGWYCLFSCLALSVANSLFLTGYAWLQLRKHFRSAVTERFSAPASESVFSTLRWPIRIAAVCAAILLLFAAFYTEEKFRGLRAWRAVQAKYSSSFQNIRTVADPPPEPPKEENFGAASVFKPLFNYHYETGPSVVWGNERAQQEVMSINLTGTRGNPPGLSTNFHPHANWAVQKPADLAEWQTYYKSSLIFSSRCPSNAAPAQAILAALSIFDPELNELDAASHRPKTRFPIHYEETHAAYWMHLPFLRNVGRVVDLRATARLASGDIAGARADIQFCVRLANTLKSEPSLFPFRMREMILLGALNPLWQGLSRHQWDEASLEIFQREFSVSILAEYQTSVRQQALFFADFYDRITEGDDTLFYRLGSQPISPRATHFYPVGWKYLNQAGLLSLAEERLVPLADPVAHRVFVTNYFDLGGAIRRSHVSIDPISKLVIPWEEDTFQEAILNAAHAQVSLDQAVIACELERWRLTHGSFPEKLDCLAAPPIDPITGANYQYKPATNGQFILYSPGWNQIDDGGQVAVKPKPDQDQDLRKGDWVWKY